MKNVQIRIGNLSFCKAHYIGKPPTFPSYHINMMYRNTNRDEFLKGYFKQIDDNTYVYDGPNKERAKWSCKYDKSCFENEESAYAIASFDYNSHEHCYECNMFRWQEFLGKDAGPRKDFWDIMLAIKASGVFDTENLEQDPVK